MADIDYLRELLEGLDPAKIKEVLGSIEPEKKTRGGDKEYDAEEEMKRHIKGILDSIKMGNSAVIRTPKKEE